MSFKRWFSIRLFFCYTIAMSEKKSIEKCRLVEELHAQARRNFPRRHVIVCIQWLVASGFDRQRLLLHFYHYWRAEQAWAVPLKAKSGNKATAITKIIRDDRRCPKNLQTTEERNFTMQTCRNSWRNMISITIWRIP